MLRTAETSVCRTRHKNAYIAIRQFVSLDWRPAAAVISFSAQRRSGESEYVTASLAYRRYVRLSVFVAAGRSDRNRVFSVWSATCCDRILTNPSLSVRRPGGKRFSCPFFLSFRRNYAIKFVILRNVRFKRFIRLPVFPAVGVAGLPPRGGRSAGTDRVSCSAVSRFAGRDAGAAVARLVECRPAGRDLQPIYDAQRLRVDSSLHCPAVRPGPDDAR